MLMWFVSSKLQSVLLQQQSFLQKCETWMDFLSQTEQKLAAEISGNYESLLEQQRDHEVREFPCFCAIARTFFTVWCWSDSCYGNLQLFQAEMFSRQQVIYSIISDGHRLLDLGQVDDRLTLNPSREI